MFLMYLVRGSSPGTVKYNGGGPCEKKVYRGKSEILKEVQKIQLNGDSWMDWWNIFYSSGPEM